MGPAAGQSESPRRMTRMRVEIPLRLATLSPAPIFAEETHTLVVNPQGCGVRLSRALDPGTRVLLDGLPGGMQATARWQTVCLLVLTAVSTCLDLRWRIRVTYGVSRILRTTGHLRLRQRRFLLTPSKILSKKRTGRI